MFLQLRAPKTAAYYTSPIERGVFWLEIKCLKSAIRLLNRVFVGQQGLDLSKEVLWVSVCQRAAELPAVKVRGQKKNKPFSPVWTRLAYAGLVADFFWPPTMTASSSDTLWPTETRSTFLERCKLVLLTQSLFKSLVHCKYSKTSWDTDKCPKNKQCISTQFILRYIGIKTMTQCYKISVLQG